VTVSVQLIVRLYARLLRLYPRSFRIEFADEMQTPTNTPTDDARSSWGEVAAGLWPFVIFGAVHRPNGLPVPPTRLVLPVGA
jgi:hypothetical protein